MSLFSRLAGTVASFFQIGGPAGAARGIVRYRATRRKKGSVQNLSHFGSVACSG